MEHSRSHSRHSLLSIVPALLLAICLPACELNNELDREHLAVGGDAGAGCTTGAQADRWHPGIYVKIEDWQLMNPSQMEAIYEELRTTPQLRGIKVTVNWGRYETRTNGVSTFNFSQLDAILDRLAAMDDKHLILSFTWREFDSNNGASLILPNDLRAGRMWTADPDWAHMRYDYAWAYGQSRNPGQYGYNLSLWNATVRSRLNAFLAALADHFDGHPNLTAISPVESAVGAPVVPFRTGESEAAQLAGQLEVIRMMRRHFTHALVFATLNFPRNYVADVVPILEDEGIGLASPNSNLARGLNLIATNPGVLTYYPTLSNRVALAPEIQGEEYRFSNSDLTTPDYPSYSSLFRRVRDDLRANYVVVQRTFPFWLGNSTTPSMLRFIRNNAAINGDTSGAGGLNRTLPSNLSGTGCSMPTADAGMRTADAGSSATDAGSRTADAGTRTADAGTPTADAGRPTTDAGPPPNAVDSWHPGIYVKIEDWQLTNPQQMEAIYEELRTTPQLRGIKVTVMWGRYETRTNGVSTFNFSQLDAILDRLAAMDDKHLILSFTWREFDSNNGASLLLPNDLRTGQMWTADPDWAHMRYDYAWAYRQAHRADLNGGQESYGYNLSLWNSTLRSRLDAFLAALADHFDGHPNLTAISPVESALGEPVVAFRTGESSSAQLAGQLAVIRMMRRHFSHALVFATLNFPRDYVASVVSILEDEGIGLASPNSNLQRGLNLTGTNPGVLTYYPTLSNRVALAPEIQGEEYRLSSGDLTTPDYPSYAYLFRRVRDDLHANYVVVQRTFPFWLGNSTTPSMLAFIRTNAAINADTTGAGGLNRTVPANLLP
jgi:hypothetical protein